MEVVFVVQHTHAYDEFDSNVKMIGVYENEQLAQAAIQRLREQPGFREAPDGFSIGCYELNRDHWDEGYFTVDASGNIIG